MAKFLDKLSQMPSRALAVESRRQKDILEAYQRDSSWGGAKYNNGLNVSGSTKQFSHWNARRNVRRIVLEDLLAGNIVNTTTNTCVGTGLRLKSSPDAKILGITKEQADEWAADVERRWALFAEDKNQHMARNLTFNQAQWLYQYLATRDGEAFATLNYSRERSLVSPVRFEMLDPDQIRSDAIASTSAMPYQHDGIDKNADGSEKAYHVWIPNPEKPGEYTEKIIPRIGRRSGRLLMIHGYKYRTAGQTRGYPQLISALQDLERITTFKVAALERAINQASIFMSVENMQQDGGDPGASMTREQRLGMVGMTNTATDGDTTDSLPSSAKVAELPTSHVGIGGISLVNMPQGDTARFLEMKAPADNFENFVGYMELDIAASQDLSLEYVHRKFSSNYSASRATLLEIWRVMEILRQDMASDFNNPVYHAWMSEEIAAKRISAPGWSDPRLRASWLKCRWLGNALPSIDPLKESKAREMNLGMSLTTGDTESHNLNGSDFGANVARNRADFEEMPVPFWANNDPEKDDKEDGDKDDG